jgi:crotonobetainyl-CoA:carnitine CoA-transferase CaiB-like acyl-CoA transferase
MGADVIKIESEKGDTTRFVGPSRSSGMSGTFLLLGRNKRSIVLDLKSEAGRKALLKLAESADVLVHSMRDQAMKKLGLSYEEVCKVNPKIIYCAGYGFGKDGPYGGKPAYDDIIQAASGMAASQGEMSGSPQYMASALADRITGLFMLNSILAALYYREQTGEGQQIEVPMFETMSSYVLLEHLYAATFIPPLGPAFYPRLTSKHRKPYKTKDGYISVMIYNDKQWSSFFQLIGKPEMMEDERYNNIGARTKHINELYAMLDELMLTKTTAEWLDLLEKADIPSMRVNRPEDLFEDPHLKEIQFFEKLTHPTEGEFWNTKFPVNFSKTPVTEHRFAPRLGEHIREILKDAGYSDQEIEELIASGAVREPGLQQSV